VLYFTSLQGGFLSLDEKDVLQWLQSGTWDPRGFFLPDFSHLYYRPLSALSIVVDHVLWEWSPFGFHLTNLVIHVVNVLLVYAVVGELLGRGLPAFFAALVFAVHPIHVEAVSWVPARTDLLATLGVLSAMWAYIRYRRTDRIVLLLLSGFFYACGLLSKEVAIVFPLLVAGYEGMRAACGPKRRGFEPIVRWMYLGLITGSYLWLRAIALAKGDQGVAKSLEAVATGVYLSIWHSLTALGFYVKKLLVPAPLNFAIVDIDQPIYVVVGGMFIAATTVMVLRRGMEGFLLWWGTVSISPALLVAASGMAWTPLAERYLYLPSVGFSVLFVTVLSRLWMWRPDQQARRVAAIAACVSVIVWFGVLTFQRNLQWEQPVKIWEDTVRKSPRFASAYNEYGIALMEARRYDEAKAQFERAIALGYTERPRQNLALIAEYEDHNTREAERLLHAELDHGVRTPRLYIRLAGTKLALAGEEPDRHEAYVREAVEMYERAYELDPSNHLMHYRIGQLLLTLGDHENAKSHFEQAANRGAEGDFFVEPSRRIVEKLRSGVYAAPPRRSS
jgi:tetratricopeptide (TPR) repeat protein